MFLFIFLSKVVICVELNNEKYQKTAGASLYRRPFITGHESERV